MPIICDKPYNSTDYSHEWNEMTSGNFDLSDFQKWAIKYMMEGQHVLITAHTGSGKTLPAEFMIKMFTQLRNDKKKVIYASPIKALSNQKLHDMRIKYPDISFGLLTGDVKDNPDADVLIVTTEILRNTLFNKRIAEETSTEMPLSFNIDLESELGGVVFDEVHYINDPHRGSVWEQSILLLPPHVQILMLSATIDKPESFAAWVQGEKEKQAIEIGIDPKIVALAPTYERVVPLTHYMWLSTHPSMAKAVKKTEIEPLMKLCNKPLVIKSASGEYNHSNYGDISNIKSFMWKNRIRVKRPYLLNSMVRYLKANDMLPAICFVFSRKHVELAAKEIEVCLYEDGDVKSSTVEKECRKILMDKLPNYREYLDLKEYTEMIALLEKGVAIHHAGIMPVLREMIELLFDRGYIKLLFATETFAVGINMPTKTVIFSSVDKWDGNGRRILYPHEYTQMAGRAGRRGLDDIGHVIHCCNLFDMPTSVDYKNMLCGPPQKLTSKFKISYGLILSVVSSGNPSLDKIESFVSQSMISKDIAKEVDYHSRTIEQLDSKLELLRSNLKHLTTPQEDLEKYIELKETINNMSQKQKKKASREMINIEQTHKSLSRDVDVISRLSETEKEIESQQTYQQNAVRYLSDEVKRVCSILLDNNFIVESDNGYSVTELGSIASQLQEMHSLAFARVVKETDYFKDFTPSDIAGLLSVFTNIRIPEETMIHFPDTDKEHVNAACTNVKKYIEESQQTEVTARINTGENDDVHYNLVSSVMEWCCADDELSCRHIINNLVTEDSQLFLGDFVKAVLKINNCATELEKIAEMTNNIPLLEKLSQLHSMTLKYVANNQSLYI
uniref:Helicase n=1 Tax=viral metagenome TaxID=1070528 RepID=A0A6C0LGE4_9ZZZZ